MGSVSYPSSVAGTSTGSKSPSLGTYTGSKNLQPLTKKSPEQMQSFILNCTTGRIIETSDDYALVDVIGFPIIRVLVPYNTFFLNGERADGSVLKTSVDVEIHFDAEFLPRGAVPPVSQEAFTLETYEVYVAVLSWQGKRPPSHKLIEMTDEVSEDKITRAGVHLGVVDEVQPGHCVVIVNDTPVVVYPRALVVDPWTKHPNGLISPKDYLDKGRNVSLTVFWNGFCFEGVKVGSGYGERYPSTEQLVSGGPSQNDRVTEMVAVTHLIKKIQCSKDEVLEPKIPYQGIIVEVPFRNYAIAVVGVIRVLVSCRVFPKKDSVVNDIVHHFEVGTSVILYAERKHHLGQYYYKTDGITVNRIQFVSGILNIGGVVNEKPPGNLTVQYFDKMFALSIWCPFHSFCGPEVSGNEEGLSAISEITKILPSNPFAKITFGLTKQSGVLSSVWLVPLEQST